MLSLGAGAPDWLLSHDLAANSQRKQRDLQRAQESFDSYQELEQSWFVGSLDSGLSRAITPKL